MSAESAMRAAIEACRAEGLDPFQVLRSLALPPSERAAWVRVLERLAGSPATAGALSDALGLEKPHVYQALSKLRERGLVSVSGTMRERSKGPASEVFALSESGRAELARVTR